MGTEQTGFYDNEVLITEIPKNDKGDVIRIKKVKLKKTVYVEIRHWYVNKDSQNLLPSKGILIPDDLVDEVATHLLSSNEVEV
jgi:predicted DNA binding protein